MGGWVENILHTVDKRGSDAKLGFLGKPGFFFVSVRGRWLRWTEHRVWRRPLPCVAGRKIHTKQCTCFLMRELSRVKG